MAMVKCENCEFLRKRTKRIEDKVYFRKCLESGDYMTIEDTRISHNCKKFTKSKQKKPEDKIRESKKVQTKLQIEEERKLHKWREKMKAR